MSFITKRERVFADYTRNDLPLRQEGKLKAFASCMDARAWSHFDTDKTEHLVELIKRNNEMCQANKMVPTKAIVDTLMGVKNTEITRLKRKIEELETLMAAYDKLDLTCEQKCELAKAHAEIKAAYKDLTEMTLDFDALNLDISAFSNFTDGVDSDYYYETGISGGGAESDRSGRSSARSKSSGRSGERSGERYGERYGDRSGGRSGAISGGRSGGRTGGRSGSEGRELRSKSGGKTGRGYKNQHGDDWSTDRESRGFQVESDLRCPCDVSTSCQDPRIDEMRENIITKDAKLSAMQNTLAVMENDVCEPYCIYAHIYTALEKIFGTLSQNSKYRLYLDLLASGKNIRCIDIKGRILFKLKILEKFSQALVAPCSQHMKQAVDSKLKDFDVMHVETSFSITPAESPKPVLDSKRAQLVADIMEHDEMKDILSKDNVIPESFADASEPDVQFITDNYSIDVENLTRLKNLQADYDDLMNCYENLKRGQEVMRIKSNKYDELEKELQHLKEQLREYNSLWNEKEHYRRRSEDIDNLKEQYFVLSEETCNLETRFKAEIEINQIKSETIDDLRNENISLEKRINDFTIAFEKEKNALQCKLKEKECTVMCQDQQIRSLSVQIDRILEHDHENIPERDSTPRNVSLMDEIESLRDQMKNLKDALVCSEEEKEVLQEQFEEKLKLISDLRLELEDKRNALEKILQRNDYLEKYTENFRDQVHELVEKNAHLSQDVSDKSKAVDHLMNVINNKSQEVSKLMDEVERNRKDNEHLYQQLQDTREKYNGGLKQLEFEKERVESSLQLARQESQELLDKVKRFENYDDLKNMLLNTMEENKRLQSALIIRENNNTSMHKELERLREINGHVFENINQLQEEKHHYKLSLELTRKESEIMQEKLSQFDTLREQLHQMKDSQEKLKGEKSRLENELRHKVAELDDAISSIHLSKKESEELLEKIQNSANLREDIIKLSKDYQKLLHDKQFLQKDLTERNKDLDNLLQALNKTKDENDQLLQKSLQVDGLEKEIADIKMAYQSLLAERDMLQNDFDSKTLEINSLYNKLEAKIQENNSLANQIIRMQEQRSEEKSVAQTTLQCVKKESEELIEKLNHYENLLSNYDRMKNTYDELKNEKEKLQKELEKQLNKLKRLELENNDLNNNSKNLIALNEDLEKALINARNQLIEKMPLKSPMVEISNELEAMKKEKLTSEKRISDLLDKLDETENVISNMTEQVMARDDTIAMMQNHINSLEDEVRKLHNSLSQVVDTGEQIKDNSYQKIDQSLNKMEAHHSKATHNMKMELAKLQNAKTSLEEQLSATKKKSEDSLREKHKYVSQVIHLQNEREAIANEVRQVEITAVGESSLTPTDCSLEEVMDSLDKIRRILDDKISKSATLEQTILKVQTSSQLLLSKADEAKKLVEFEKQKIINEKEEAIAEKLDLEKQLSDLKARLEQQSINDEKIIRDLEAEILNQELIIDSINKSTNNYTLKLEEELHNLRDLYENALAKVSDLQAKITSLSEDQKNNLNIINKVNSQLAQKATEVATLQEILNKIKNISKKEVHVQVGTLSNNANMASQTEQGIDPESNIEEIILDDIKNIETIPENYSMNKKSKSHQSQGTDILGKKRAPPINEVQILTANIEPTFDFVKTSYLDYKMKRLGPGKLETYTLSCDEDTTDSNLIHEANTTSDSLNPHLLDIYNRESLHTDSGETAPGMSRPHRGKPTFAEPTENKNHDSKDVTGSTTDDTDVFVIYQDTESSHAGDNYNYKNVWPGQSQVLVQSVVAVEPKFPNLNATNKRVRSKTKDREDKEPKQKLYISLPIISNQDTSLENNKSIEPFTKKNVYTTSKEQSTSIKITDEQIERDSFTDDQKKERISHTISPIYETTNRKERNPSPVKHARRSRSENFSVIKSEGSNIQKYPSLIDNKTVSLFSDSLTTNKSHKALVEESVMVNTDPQEYYEDKIKRLTDSLRNMEKDCKKKLEAIKVQYDNNIQQIINEHNLGVKNIQELHEETLHDIINVHENETENLRSMSIEALRKAEKLEKENRLLKTKIFGETDTSPDSLVASSSPEMRRRKKCHSVHKVLTKTNVEAFNLRPKLRSHGPCTCSLDINISDTIRNIFDQVDVEQRKMAEHSYLKFIASKINNGNIEGLDAQELSFLHLKVCRTWKNKLSKEEALQKKIDSLESELMNKQRHAQQHIAELDRKVAEEKRRLQEVREAMICRTMSPPGSCRCDDICRNPPSSPTHTAADLKVDPTCKPCTCRSGTAMDVGERLSAGDLIQGMAATLKPKRSRNETHRATLARLDIEERRGKKLLDEKPTRLRRAHDRQRHSSPRGRGRQDH